MGSMTATNNTIGLVSAIRVKGGYSQEALARELGVSFASVNAWERGRANPRNTHLKDLHALAESMGIRTDLMVLVIDDDPTACLVMEGLVAGSHIPASVVSTTDPSKGLILCGALNPDLLLIDVRMPGIDGFEVAERLAELGPGNVPSLVLVTAWSKSDVSARAFAAGHKVLYKPIRQESIDELLASVATKTHPARV